MNCQMPQNLERADPRDRTFPPSWKDAAIRALYDKGVKCQGVNCSHGERVFFGGNQLRMLQADHIIPWSLGGLTTHLRQIKTKTLAIKHMFFEVCSTSLPHRLISSSHSVPSSYN